MTKISHLSNNAKKAFPVACDSTSFLVLPFGNPTYLDSKYCVPCEIRVKITPYKYNGGQVYMGGEKPSKTVVSAKKELVINVDWFECSTLGVFIDIKKPQSVIAASDDVYLARDEIRPNGTKHFENCYSVYLHGELFGHINTTPRASILDPNLSLFKVENHILYQRGWLARFDYVMESIGIRMHNVSRLDIAVDGAGFVSDYEMLIARKYDKVGRAKMTSIHKPNGDVEGFYIGSRSSEKFIRCYDKTKELDKNHSKGYIVDWWEKNGFDVGDKVERMEVTLKHKALKLVNDFDYSSLENSAYLAGVMRAIFNGIYRFRVKDDKQKNKSRLEKIDAVNWAYFDANDIDRLPKTNKPSVVWAVQQAVTFEMRESYAGLDAGGNDLWDTAFKRSYDRCLKYGLLGWFERKVPKWKKDKDYHDLMRSEVKEARKMRIIIGKNSSVFTSS